MSGLLFLTTEDFFIKQGSKGNILCTAIPELSLILFYSTQCSHCQILIPMFKTLPGTISGCQFGMINVSTNKQCIFMSKETISPIVYVPNIILYADGQPFMRYNGPHHIDEIKRFIIEVSNKINQKQKFTANVTIKKDNKKTIPEYSIGLPLCGNDDKCYLNMDDAYISIK